MDNSSQGSIATASRSNGSSSRRTRQPSSRGKALPSISSVRHAIIPTEDSGVRLPSDTRFDAFAARVSSEKEVRKRRSRSFSNAPIPSSSSAPRRVEEVHVEALAPSAVIESFASKPPPRPPRSSRRRLSTGVPDSPTAFMDRAMTAMDELGQANLTLSTPVDSSTSLDHLSTLASPIALGQQEASLHYSPDHHDIEGERSLAEVSSVSTSRIQSRQSQERSRRLSSLFNGLGFSGATDLPQSRREASIKENEVESDVFESAEEGLEDGNRFTVHAQGNIAYAESSNRPPSLPAKDPVPPANLSELNQRNSILRQSQEYSWVLSSIAQQPQFSEDSAEEQSHQGEIEDPSPWHLDDEEGLVSSGMAHSTTQESVRAWLPTVLRAGSPPCSSPELGYSESSTPTSSTQDAFSTYQQGYDSPDTSWQAHSKSSVTSKASKRQSQALSLYTVPKAKPVIVQTPPKEPRKRSKTVEKLGNFFTPALPRTRSTSFHQDQVPTPKTIGRDTRRRSQSFSAIAKTPRPLLASKSTYSNSPGNVSPGANSLCETPQAVNNFRSSVPETAYRVFKDTYGSMELKRQEVVWELCDTEESFVKGLRGITRVFMQPLRTPQGRWIDGIPAIVSRLFDWMDDILHLHTQISSVLRAAQSAQSPITIRIADAFLPFISRLEVHQPYIVRFAKVTQVIDAMTSDANSDFGEFVRMQQNLPDCGSMTLSSFLLKPVQRLMKYPLFFKHLLELTPATHPDHLATLSLLHSTDVIIRVMQEVQAREEEYERIKVIQQAIKGLPAGFELARRDRKLLCQGLLRRVHISDRDQLRLGVENLSADQAQQGYPTIRSPSAQSIASIAPVRRTTTRSNSDHSEATGSEESGSSLAPESQHSSTRSSPAMASSTFSLASKSSAGSSRLDPNQFLFVRGAAESNSATLRTNAKETPVYAFVFNDVVVLATRHVESGKLMRSGKANQKKDKETFKLLEGIGLSRVLGVEDMSGRTEHEHLLDIDLLPISSEAELTNISFCDASLASSIYLAIPSTITPASRSRSTHSGLRPSEAQAKECQRWATALEQSFFSALRSLSFPSEIAADHLYPADPASSTPGASHDNERDSWLGAGLPIPRSPSQQSFQREQRRAVLPHIDSIDYDIEEERQERGWWAARLKKVKREWQAEEAAMLQARMLAAVGSNRSGRSTMASDPSAFSASALRRSPRIHPVNGRPGNELPRTASRQFRR